MREINVKEILRKNMPNNGYLFLEDVYPELLRAYRLSIKEIATQIIDKCAEDAEVIDIGSINSNGESEDYSIVDKDSINNVYN